MDALGPSQHDRHPLPRPRRGLAAARATRIAALVLATLVAAVGGLVAAPGSAFAQWPAPAASRAIVAPDAGVNRAKLDVGVTRSQPVAVDLALLADVRARLLADPATPQSIALPAFGATVLTLVISRVETVGDAVAYHGTVDGVDLSSVVLVERDGIVAGNINAVRQNYQIRYRGPEFGHELRDFDQSIFRDHDREPVAPKMPETLDSAPSGLKGAQAIEADDGSTIDVMVAYTAAARTAVGGTPAMQTLIALGITETNAAYANSGVIQRVRLVNSVEVTYTESGDFGTDLDRLISTNDGFMDNVHTLRDQFGADIVSLWIEDNSTTCGLAPLMQVVNTSFAPNAFNVVNRSCATGYYSFGHEMGHNMGLRHDPFVDSGQTNLPYAYAHGYVDTANLFRTVLGYNNACGNNNCTRIQYFSNPNVTFGGNTTGDVATSNNSLALNNTRVTVANFRQSVNVAAPPAITSAAAATFYVGVNGVFNVTATGSPAPTITQTGALPGTVTFAGGVLSGTPAAVGVFPIQFKAANGNLPDATQNFTLTISAKPACTLDLDGNGQLDALTDGLMILRTMFGLTGTQVTNGAIGVGAVRTTWAVIQPVIALGALDVDGNGNTDALTDGLMVLRALFGLTGTQVTTGAVATNPLPTRTTWAGVRGYLNGVCGSSFAP